MFFEYRKALNTRNTLNVLNNLNIFNSRYPFAKTVREGKIDSKSTNAIGVKGYRKNDKAPRLNFLSAVSILNI